MNNNIKSDPYRENEHVGIKTINYINEIGNHSLIELEKSNVDGNLIKNLIRLWVKVSLLLTRRRPEIAISSLLIHLIPVIGDMSIHQCSKIQLNRVFNYLLAEGKVNEAKRVFALTKQFFSWCEHQGYIEHNPLASMTRKDVGGKAPEPRSRILSDAEIWCFWHGLDMWDFSEQVRWGLRLCLLSARRPDEVFRARKDEFNLEYNIWRQGSRNKSRRDHTMPISPLMRVCIDNLFAASPDSKWLCPSRISPNSPTSKGAPAQAVRRMIRSYDEFGLDEFMPRDLRRTVRTKLAALGVQNDVSRKIMNHALEGIDRVYDRHDYFEQMRNALDLYSDEIERIISSESYRELRHDFQVGGLFIPTTSKIYCC
ncbi:site-specific integrase [Xenorhabdus bovienii]|uniref:tyrosine-type recombinase/integrase n=1 Tax=Xenorhabdus bovienii TaxID=40576 RepID=UPI0023B23CF2|nr:site-specific integrase [Xenorhabdus bovienii]MDE9494360.1 site-specific integrase [Xenorhabdus bovienii]MDE9502799.1 site-specific integrase [Xenorhabdus bovienii]MDE9526414.1 site-specific integrase [Xenorhabdus bovienii]